MNAFPYRVFVRWSEPDGAYVAEVPAVPGAGGDGASMEEAIRLAQESAREIVDVKKEFGDPVPPSDCLEQKHSGQLRLRLPKSLHRDLALAADDEGVSLNQLMVGYLTAQLHREAMQRFAPLRAVAPGSGSPWTIRPSRPAQKTSADLYEGMIRVDFTTDRKTSFLFVEPKTSDDLVDAWNARFATCHAPHSSAPKAPERQPLILRVRLPRTESTEASNDRDLPMSN